MINFNLIQRKDKEYNNLKSLLFIQFKVRASVRINFKSFRRTFRVNLSTQDQDEKVQ